MTDYTSNYATSPTIYSSPTAIRESQLKCPACQQFFVKPVRLSCNHCFCMMCGDKWLRNCTTCPICRVPTLTPFRDLQLEELVVVETQNNTAFVRAIGGQLKQKLRQGRTVREVKALQKESTRASTRRPKNFKFTQLKTEENLVVDENNVRQRQSVLQRSFRRIKQIF